MYSLIMAKAIQLSIQNDLLDKIDHAARRLGESRSRFVAEALVRYLSFLETRLLEQKQVAGYRKKPVKKDEFTDWEGEQVWPEL